MPLQDKLLSFGGDWVALVPECDLKTLMEKGQLFKDKIILKKMHPDKSHINSAQLWLTNPETYQIATGWALCNDGMWDQHTWLLKGKNIIETTKPMKMYFGIILDNLSAFIFWCANTDFNLFG
jgi:hypothetical protein